MPWVKKETQSNNVCKEGRPKKQWPEKDAENQEKVPRRGSLKKRGPRTCVQMEGIVPLSCPISPQGRKRKTVSLVLNASVKEEGWSGGMKRSTHYRSSPQASSLTAANHEAVPERSWEAHDTEHKDERPSPKYWVNFLFSLLLYTYLQISTRA